MPGNLGLKDQALALRWVYENIKEFGGSPYNIAIQGRDSIHFHLMASASAGLFNRAIFKYGNALTPDYWVNFFPIGDVIRLLRVFNKHRIEKKSATLNLDDVQYLQRVSVSKLNRALSEYRVTTQLF